MPQSISLTNAQNSAPADLDGEDKAANDTDHSHAEGRLFSSYDTEEHGTIWVITEDLRGEAGGPITTVLFPEDY